MSKKFNPIPQIIILYDLEPNTFSQIFLILWSILLYNLEPSTYGFLAKLRFYVYMLKY